MAAPENRYKCKGCGGELFFAEERRSFMKQKNIWWLYCKTCMQSVMIEEA